MIKYKTSASHKYFEGEFIKTLVTPIHLHSYGVPALLVRFEAHTQ